MARGDFITYTYYWELEKDKPSHKQIHLGAKGVEIDTGKEYRWNNSNWIEQKNYYKSEHDLLTDSKKVINTDHYYIHDGLAYKAYILLSTVGDTPVEYSIQTPSTDYLHFKNLSLTALGGTCRVTLLRDTSDNPLVIDSSGEDPGTDLIGPNNLNDNAQTKDSKVNIKKGPSYITEQQGEAWFLIQVVGDSTNQYTSVANSQINDNEECVMRPDKYYTLKIEKIGEDIPNNIFIELFWYNEKQGMNV